MSYSARRQPATSTAWVSRMQPFLYDSPITTTAFEAGGGLDTTKPTLARVRARKSGRRVKVSFTVSERSVVTVRHARGRKTVKSKKANASTAER